MIIKLSGRNTLHVFRDENNILRMDLADYPGKINFRRELKNFLKSKGKSFYLRNSDRVGNYYDVFTEDALTSLDVLRLACRLERRKVGSSKSRKN